MNKLLQDGLKINQTVHLSEDKNNNNQIVPRIVQFLMILFGTLCFTFALREGLGVLFNIIEVFAAVVLCTGIIYGLCLIPSFHMIKAYMGILCYGFYLYIILPSITNGFYLFENLVIDRISTYYGYNLPHYLANKESAMRDSTMLMITIIIPLIALLAVGIMKSRLLTVTSLIFSMPLVAIFLFGMVPSERLLLCYIVIMLYLSRSGLSLNRVVSKEQKNLIHRINSRAAIWISLFTIVLFVILKLFINDENYHKVKEIKTAKSEIQTAMNNFSYNDMIQSFQDFSLFGGTKTIGGLSGGKLGKTGKVEFNDDEQLIVTLPYDALTNNNNSIYLKGYVGSVYTGSRWNVLAAGDKKSYKEMQPILDKRYFQPLNQTNQMLQFAFAQNQETSVTNDGMYDSSYNIMEGTMKIEYKNANKNFIYAPYFTDFNKVTQTHEEEDLYMAPLVLRNSYEFNFFFNFYVNMSGVNFFTNNIDRLKKYALYEQFYRSYVNSVYTQLPDKGVERIKQDFGTPELKADSTPLSTKINYIMNYLNQNTKYSLSPGALPSGKDFVEYFLYENHVGYCAHYASAATLMLRAMGVPARYVEGYVVRSGKEKYVQPNQNVMVYGSDYKENWNEMSAEVTVTDRDAHAWVEIYLEGCGWFPVEFTPSSNNFTDLTTLDNLSSIDKLLEENKGPTPTPTLTPSPTPKQDNHPSVTPKAPDKQESDTPKPGGNGIHISVKSIGIGITILLIVALFGLIIAWRTRHRNHMLHSPDRNKRALYLLVETDKMLSFHKLIQGKGKGAEDFEEYLMKQVDYIEQSSFSAFMSIVRKARFGQGTITDEEIKTVELLHQSLSTKIFQKLPFYKKLYWKLVFLI